MTRRVSTKVGEVLRDLPMLETDRLILRKMTPDDAEAVFAYASDPEVTRYVIWETHRSIEDSRAFLDLATSKYRSGGEPDWGIVYKGDHRLLTISKLLRSGIIFGAPRKKRCRCPSKSRFPLSGALPTSCGR